MIIHDNRSTVALRPGVGRLGMVSGVFTVLGGVAAILSLSLARYLLGLDVRNISTKELGMLAGALSLTFGCFRTSRLLDHRQREGVVSAIIMLAAPFASYFTGSHPDLGLLGASGLGIALLASVWRYLNE